MPREINSLGNLIFDPSINRNQRESAPVKNLTIFNFGEGQETSATGSFRFDAPGSAIKSTQQLNVDFSNFENHTFFGSARAKVQKSFDKIINNYPFDGSRSEVESFVDGLTGFEKYVLDSFPTALGYLHFSGSSGPAKSTDGTYLSIKDFKGSFSPGLTKQATGESIVNFENGPFTAEFFINIPSGTINENSIIFQKINSAEGLTICLSSSYGESSPLGQAKILTILNSGSISLTSSMAVPKGTFQHCSIVFDKSNSPGKIMMYRNSILQGGSSEANLGSINFVTSPVTIGSGTIATAKSQNFQFVPSATFSGSIDELRFWHKSKTQSEIYDQMKTNVFSDPYLKLYYKFNEPSGSFTSNGSDLVLDGSGNGLHARVKNFNLSLRYQPDGPPPVISESSKFSPILFPSYQGVIDLNTLLINSASDYDAFNPNLVTKLIPVHYFQEAQVFEGFTDEAGNIGNSLEVNQDQPGGGKIGQPQIIAGLLYTMSETFDELKMFVDEFKRLLKVDYVSQETISDQLLPWLSRYYGIRLPNLFASANTSQINDGKNVNLAGTATQGLQAIQNGLWRRIFADLPKTLATRGTRESLESTLRNFGISSKGPVRIRELGGSKSLTLGDSYTRRTETAAMLDFSGSIGPLSGPNQQGFYSSSPIVISSYLSSSRTEPGIPSIAGNLSSGYSSNTSDGLFTSGSWTFEGIYKFTSNLPHTPAQSLARIFTTGTLVPSGGLVANLVAYAEDPDTLGTGSLQLWCNPSTDPTVPVINLNLTGVNVFDGSKWSISFGRERNDLIGSYVSSSYFIRAGKFTPAGLETYEKVSGYFLEKGTSGINVFEKINSTLNSSGSFVAIGTQEIGTSAASLLNTSSISSLSRISKFSGRTSNIRFWSKALTETETKTHIMNFKSLGVEDPSKNFNFVSSVSGSFERIRLDVSTDQVVTKSDSSGKITLFDFSQNNKTFSGYGFEPSVQVVQPERFDFDVLSSDFKSGENPNKIRIRSFKDQKNVDLYQVSQAPLYSLPQNEEAKDDRRIQIEISALQALNEDIMNIFATLDYLDNAIGSPELVFSQEYPSLRNLRRIYFNRLTEKLNLTSFFQFFKWFDDSLGDYLEQLLPSNSKFLGTSYVIEPHALERPKFVYNYYDMYLGEEKRGGKPILLLQQIVGTVRKI